MMKIHTGKKFFPEKEELVVVAIDPGEHIGIAVMMLGRLDKEFWDLTTTTKALRFPEDVSELRDVELFVADVVVLEQWVYQPRKKQLKNWQSAIECRGWVKGALVEMGKADILVEQTPAQKEFVSPDFIKQAFPDLPGKTHQFDAARHLLFYIEGQV